MAAGPTPEMTNFGRVDSPRMPPQDLNRRFEAPGGATCQSFSHVRRDNGGGSGSDGGNGLARRVGAGATRSVRAGIGHRLTTTGSGPASKYDCALSIRPAADAFTGADGSGSEIGWEGNQQGVVTCLGGVFFIQDGFYQNYGFGIYDGAPTTWTDADGYLPAQITSFSRNGARVSITEFADRVVLAGARLCRRLQPGRGDEPHGPRH